MSVSFDVSPLELRTRHAFTISRGGGESWKNVLLHVRVDGEDAWGEGAPRSYYGDEVPNAVRAIEDWMKEPELLLDGEPEEIFPAMHGSMAARNAIDNVLHDLWARRAGVHVSEDLGRRYGLARGSLPPTSFTIGIDDTAKIIVKVREASEYPILKIKLGTDRDLEILEAVRSASDAEIRVDANCAWSVEQTKSMSRRLIGLGVTLIEQPLAPGDLEGYRELHGKLELPVYVDESCKTLDDVERLAGVVDGINIKLSKCGGLWEAARMIRCARALGLKIMVGCFIESSAAITAAACLAPYVDVLDLDGAALLAQDPFQGVRIPEGRIVLPNGPGMGIRRASR